MTAAEPSGPSPTFYDCKLTRLPTGVFEFADFSSRLRIPPVEQAPHQFWVTRAKFIALEPITVDVPEGVDDAGVGFCAIARAA